MQVGDEVKVVLDDEMSPDTKKYHGRTAKIVDIEFDDLSSVTGDSKDNFMISLKFENGETPDIHFRRRDLKAVNDR